MIVRLPNYNQSCQQLSAVSWQPTADSYFEVVLRLRKSMRMNCPSVIVFVK
jgi:hypothetical protein